MYNPLLQHKDFRYTRLAAISWYANPMLQPAILTSYAGNALVDYITKDNSDLPIVLNSLGISTAEDHSLSSLEGYLKRTDRCVAFLMDDSNQQLISEITSELNDVNISSESIDGVQVLLCGRKRNLAEPIRNILEVLPRECDSLEKEFIRRSVAQCYKPFGTARRLDSTPLLASGVLNARALISDPQKFVWISLLLADLFQRVIEERKPRTNRILAVSLRGSPFAAAVRVLAQSFSPSLEIIDHIGPRHELLEGNVCQADMYGGEYVLVSDFVIGGTEIKVARAYAMSQGGALNNAISIGAYLPEGSYDKNVALRALVSIPDTVPELTYEFHP